MEKNKRKTQNIQVFSSIKLSKCTEIEILGRKEQTVWEES